MPRPLALRASVAEKSPSSRALPAVGHLLSTPCAAGTTFVDVLCVSNCFLDGVLDMAERGLRRSVSSGPRSRV